MIQELLQAIMNGTTPLALFDDSDTLLADTICEADTTLSLAAPVDVLDGNDVAAGEAGGEGTNHETILIAVLVPAAVLLVAFMVYRIKRRS
jgi:hypothetical protein